MKPTDLMLEDWVLWKNRYVQIVRTCSVVYSFGHRDVWLAHCNDDNVIECHDISQISPIPLTPEILEKNGFIKVNSQRYDYGYPDTDCYVKVNPKKNMIHVNGRNANSNLYSHSFVHELQRALRLCGLNEIADNFKV